MVKDIISEVMYHRNRVFFVQLPVLNQLEFNSDILKNANDNYSSHNWNENYDAFYQQEQK